MSVSRAAPSPSLPAADLARSLRLGVIEGVCWAVMIGFGETYFLANALRLGANTLEQALVVTLPLALGAGGPLLALRLLYKAPRRRPVVVSLTALQCGVLLAMSLSDFAGALTPERLIALACVYQMCSQGANTAWSSWYGDLVPAELRGRYFARRNRAVHISTAGAVLIGGLLLARLEPSALIAAGTGAGFRVILLLGALARALSAALLARSPEPQFRGVASPRRTARFLATDRGSAAWRLLAFGAAVQLGTYVASPYFVPFMLQELKLTYFEYTMATLMVVAAKSIFLPAWGRVVDGHGARAVYPLAALLTAMIPIPFILSDGIALVLVGQMLSGMAWAGYELSFFTLILESSYRRTRMPMVAAQNIFNGAAQLSGGLLGALVLGSTESRRVVFGASVGARMMLSLLAPLLLVKLLGEARARPRRREVLLRVIGFRAHGGLVHRPIVEGEDDEEVAAEAGVEEPASAAPAASASAGAPLPSPVVVHPIAAAGRNEIG
jgi:MFS family permease